MHNKKNKRLSGLENVLKTFSKKTSRLFLLKIK